MKFILSLLLFTINTAYAGNPSDIQNFLSKKEMCEHWNAEEPYDKARAQQINEGINKSCTGLDKQLIHLKHKYNHNPKILKLLENN